MKAHYFVAILLTTTVVILTSCRDKLTMIPAVDSEALQQYWFQGQAEISSYALSQARYDSIHEGTTVLIFVTEDFSKSKHVKTETPRIQRTDAIPVLKLNTLKEFVTGIYKYSLMNSVYTPIDRKEYPHSLKLMASTQEWCGQTFMQANWKGNRYDVQQMSYFEDIGDTRFSLERAFLEDELWNVIRIAPERLPVGKVKMIASSMYLRLSHRDNKVYDATTTLVSADDYYRYTVDYPELGRQLEIHFEISFPHKILGWKETYGDHEVTTAQLLHTIKDDYWNHHMPKDKALRAGLDLED